MSSRIPLLLVTVSLVAASVAATLATAQDKATADPWCRLDDPGTSEVERRNLKLSAKNLSALRCPAREDPERRPDELILRMPCGRAMVFRKVALNLRNVLDYQKGYFGVVPENPADPLGKPARAVVSGPREGVVSGSLSLGQPGSASQQRGFYVGKYEVTALQYAIYERGLLTADGAHANSDDAACKPIVEEAARATGTLMLPATRVSWFEAMDFSRRYTEWLLARDRASIAAGKQPTELPWQEATPAFLRLLTASEWEYAARGGDVAPAAQSARVYDVVVDGVRRPGTLEEIASISSAQNPPPAESDVHYIGRKLPNLFGTYDMVGNAAEIVLNLFQPRRPDVLLDMVGGYVQMGGSAGDSDASIGVGARTEVPLFRKDGLARSPSTGFRLVVSAPFIVNKRQGAWGEAIGNPSLDADLEAAYRMLLEQTSAPGAVEQSEADQRLRQMQQDLEKQKGVLERQQADSDTWKKFADQLQAELKSVKASLDRSTAALNEREALVRIERFRSLVLAASNINVLNRNMRGTDFLVQELRSKTQEMESRLPEVKDKAEKDKLKKAATENQLAIERNNKRKVRLSGSVDSNFSYYVDSILWLSANTDQEARFAIEQTTRQLQTRAGDFYKDFLRLADQHIREARTSRGSVSATTKTGWLDAINKVVWEPQP